jgi:hypothetical protein
MLPYFLSSYFTRRSRLQFMRALRSPKLVLKDEAAPPCSKTRLLQQDQSISMNRNFYPESAAADFQSSSLVSRLLAIWPCSTFRRISSEERKSASLKFIRFRPAIKF